MVPKCQTPKVLERNSKTLKPLQDERSVLTLLLANSESNSGLVSFLTGVAQKSVKAKNTSYKLHRSYWNSGTANFFTFYLNKRKLQKYLIHNLFDCRVTQLLLLADIEKWVAVSKALPVLCVKQPSIRNVQFISFAFCKLQWNCNEITKMVSCG